jgi:hypothetical protein
MWALKLTVSGVSAEGVVESVRAGAGSRKPIQTKAPMSTARQNAEKMRKGAWERNMAV